MRDFETGNPEPRLRMGLGCFGLFQKQGKKGGNTSATKIQYPRVEKPLKDPQERIDQSVEDITLQTALNDLDKHNEQPVSKDSGIGTFTGVKSKVDGPWGLNWT